jgi:hypothetical protein
MATRIKARAIRRMGEVFEEIEANVGGTGRATNIKRLFFLPLTPVAVEKPSAACNRTPPVQVVADGFR